ncbi:hypothetical protein GGR53DRAFT_471171 [Hypoxylon sp. FL1150]|nr:hypothetical protein GGR53DRAFT_471171 [Hypoxylon sp. FL1150]
MAAFVWDVYYISYLQVVHGLSITISNYVLNAFTLTSYFVIPIYLLGTALLIYFRVPLSEVEYLVMCQFLVGFNAGMIGQMKDFITMASVRHQDVAVAVRRNLNVKKMEAEEKRVEGNVF